MWPICGSAAARSVTVAPRDHRRKAGRSRPAAAPEVARPSRALASWKPSVRRLPRSPHARGQASPERAAGSRLFADGVKGPLRQRVTVRRTRAVPSRTRHGQCWDINSVAKSRRRREELRNVELGRLIDAFSTGIESIDEPPQLNISQLLAPT